jgi:exosortase E/protease (VPEID-CTERM system)
MLRWIALTLLLLAELLIISNWLDTSAVSQRDGPFAVAIGYVPILLNTTLSFVGLFLLTTWVRAPDQIRRLRLAGARHCWKSWVVLHILAVFAFALTSSHIFNGEAGSSPIGIKIGTAWAGLATGSIIAWIFALAPPAAWRRVLVESPTILLASALVAIAVSLVGKTTQLLWSPLAHATLWISRQQLNLVYQDVLSDPGRRILGTSRFQVEIASSCSGYEGIGLIVIFVGVYLWLFRRTLRFPRALLLFPAGAIIIWLFNTLRITALVAVGSSWSPQIAAGGFHSQAGWISFILVALGVIFIAQRSRWLALGPKPKAPRPTPQGELATALLMPSLVLVATGMLAATVSAGFDTWYPVKITASGLALWYYRNTYKQMAWAWSWHALAVGAAVFGLWVLLERMPEAPSRLGGQLAALPVWLAVAWLAFRLAGSVLIVPLAEELAFRGYLLRKLTSRDFERVDPRRFSLIAFFGSSLLFGALHGRWIAGALAGTAYAYAVYRRGRISDAILAHATTNGLLATYVLASRTWYFWE